MPMSLPKRVVTTSIFAIFLGWSVMAAAGEEIVVEVENAVGVAAYYEQIGFHDLDNHPERLQSVPRTRLMRIPGSAMDVWSENVSLRKSVFYRLALSGVLQVNEQILAERQRLTDLSLDNLTTDDRAWVVPRHFSTSAKRFKIAGQASSDKRNYDSQDETRVLNCHKTAGAAFYYRLMTDFRKLTISWLAFIYCSL